MENGFERSLMIDIGRKYYSPAGLKKFLKLLVKYRMNTLILHFSDDCGVGLQCPDHPFLAGRDGMLCSQRELGTVHPDERYLSLTEMEDLVRTARGMGIRVIPSYDSPGHLNYTVKRVQDRIDREGEFTFSYEGSTYRIIREQGLYRFFKNGEDMKLPEETAGVYGIASYYVCEGQTSRVKGTNNTSCSRGIDLTNEAAVALVHSILESYARFFRSIGCTGIDVGGDEFLGYREAVKDLSVLSRWKQLEHLEKAAREATGLPTAVAYDYFVLYCNDIYRRMKELGYAEVRIWNDEFMRSSDTGWSDDPEKHIQFDPGFLVQYWSSGESCEAPVNLAKHGYDIIGTDAKFCYYVQIDDARCVPPKAYTLVYPESIRKNWTPFGFGAPDEKGERPEGWDLRRSGMEEHLRGTMFCIWSDCPVLRTEEQVLEELEPLLLAWTEKLEEETK